MRRFRSNIERISTNVRRDTMRGMERLPTAESFRPARFQTLEHVVIETLGTGDRVEGALEDNGRTQRRCIDRVSYDAAGRVDFAEQISREELG